MRDFYGGEVCLANLARGLVARGHEVTCVVRPDARLAPVNCRHGGLATRELPLVDWYEPVSVSRLGAWLRRERVDIVHTHTPRDWFIATAATVGGARAQHGDPAPAAAGGPRRRSNARSCAGSGAMIAVSDAVRAGRLAAWWRPIAW